MRHSINPTRSSLDRPADGPRSPSLIDLTPAFSFHEIFTRYEISPFSSISCASRSSELAAGFQAGRKAGKHIRRACDFPLFFLRLRALLPLIFYNIKPTSEIVEHVILLALPLPLLSFHLSLSLLLSALLYLSYFLFSYIMHFTSRCISLCLSLSLSPFLNLYITRTRLICYFLRQPTYALRSRSHSFLISSSPAYRISHLLPEIKQTTTLVEHVTLLHPALFLPFSHCTPSFFSFTLSFYANF